MAWPRRSGPYPDVKGKDVTPTDLLNAARTMVTQSRPGTAGLWPRAAALLGRQALEAALDELWSRTHPGLERASMRCQLLCLPIVLTDRELAGRAAHAWVALTRACQMARCGGGRDQEMMFPVTASPSASRRHDRMPIICGTRR